MLILFILLTIALAGVGGYALYVNHATTGLQMYLLTIEQGAQYMAMKPMLTKIALAIALVWLLMLYFVITRKAIPKVKAMVQKTKDTLQEKRTATKAKKAAIQAGTPAPVVVHRPTTSNVTVSPSVTPTVDTDETVRTAPSVTPPPVVVAPVAVEKAPEVQTPEVEAAPSPVDADPPVEEAVPPAVVQEAEVAPAPKTTPTNITHLVCPTCGKVLAKNARFCVHCGSKLNAPITQKEDAQ